MIDLKTLLGRADKAKEWYELSTDGVTDPSVKIVMADFPPSKKPLSWEKIADSHISSSFVMTDSVSSSVAYYPSYKVVANPDYSHIGDPIEGVQNSFNIMVRQRVTDTSCAFVSFTHNETTSIVQVASYSHRNAILLGTPGFNDEFHLGYALKANSGAAYECAAFVDFKSRLDFFDSGTSFTRQEGSAAYTATHRYGISGYGQERNSKQLARPKSNRDFKNGAYAVVYADDANAEYYSGASYVYKEIVDDDGNKTRWYEVKVYLADNQGEMLVSRDFDDTSTPQSCTVVFSSNDAKELFSTYFVDHPLVIAWRLKSPERRNSYIQWQSGTWRDYAGQAGTTSYMIGTDGLPAKFYRGVNQVEIGGETICDFEINKIGSDTGSFTIGSVASSNIVLNALSDKADGSKLPKNYSGMYIEPIVGYKLSGEADYSYVPMGFFIVDPSETELVGRNIVRITAYDILGYKKANKLRKLDYFYEFTLNDDDEFDYQMYYDLILNSVPQRQVCRYRPILKTGDLYQGCTVQSNLGRINSWYTSIHERYHFGDAFIKYDNVSVSYTSCAIPNSKRACIRDLLSRSAASACKNVYTGYDGVARLNQVPTSNAKIVHDEHLASDVTIHIPKDIVASDFNTSETEYLNHVYFHATYDDDINPLDENWEYYDGTTETNVFSLELPDDMFMVNNSYGWRTSNLASGKMLFDYFAQLMMLPVKSYIPHDITIYGAPFIEPYDTIEVELCSIDYEEDEPVVDVVNVCPFNVTITYNGGLKTHIVAESSLDGNATVPSTLSSPNTSDSVSNLADIARSGKYTDLKMGPRGGMETVTFSSAGNFAYSTFSFPSESFSSAPHVVACLGAHYTRYQGVSVSVSHITSSQFRINVYTDTQQAAGTTFSVRWIAIPS